MPDQRQEWKQLAFGGPDPNVGHARVPGQSGNGGARQVTAENVRLLSDGAFWFCRDQFYIEPPAVTPLSLFEYKTSSLNQLLAFASDGGLYRLTTDWSAASPTQWDYGYELFGTGTWSSLNTSGEPAWATDNTSGLSTNEEGCFALAQYNDYLYVALDSAQMLRWDGDSLIPVGLLGPFSPPVGSLAEENFTSTASEWIESDTGGFLTVTSNTVIATAMPSNQTTSYLYQPGLTIGDFEWRCQFNLDSAQDGATIGVLAVGADDLGGASGVNVSRGGSAYHLDCGGQVSIVPGTTYYLRLVRHGTVETLYVHITSDYSDTPGIASGTVATGGTQIQVMFGGTGGNTATVTATLSHLQMTVAASGGGEMLAGTYGYVLTFVECLENGAEVWESMPSPASVPITLTNTSGISLSGISTGPEPNGTNVMYRKLYRGFTTDASAGAEMGEYDFVARIEDNTTTTFTDTLASSGLGATFPYDYAIPPWCEDMVLHNDRAFFFRVTATSESYTAGLYYDASAPITTGLDNTVFYSELGAPWYCSIFNQFRVGDAALAVGGCSWRDQLFIFKTNGVHVYSGWTDETFDLSPLDDHGACAYRAWAAGSQGVMWASHDGLMFYDGAKVVMLASYTDGGLTRPRFDDGEYQKMCFSHGKYYFLSGTDLWWFDAQKAVFGCDTMGPVGDLGIQAFQLGDGQAHVLCGRTWDSSTSGGQEITVLHGGEDFSNFAGKGTGSTDYFAPIDIIFAPFVPEPNDMFTVTEIWLDASWTSSGDTTKDPKVYWSNDDMATWTEAGAAPQGNGKLVLRDVQGAPVYLRILATEAKDFRLYGAKAIVPSKQQRGYA